MKKYLTLVIILSVLALWPFFKKGYFESHDGEWMVIRFSAFHQTLRAGQFPVRFVDRLNNNYGYPVINFLYPLPFYLAEIPKAMKMTFVDSIKVTTVISTLVSTVAMFWALSIIFSNKAAAVGSIVFLFSPYRFVDLYVRGSLGENVAFAFLPLIFGCLLKISKGEKIYLLLLSISIALLITSHNVIAAIFVPFFILTGMILNHKRKELLAFFLLGFGISGYFWIPAIYDLKFVRLLNIKVSNINDHLVPFKNLIITSWGYGPTPSDSLSVQLGILTLLIFVISVALFFKTKQNQKLIFFFLLSFVLSVFMLTVYSKKIWEMAYPLEIIQFPWRLLSIIVFISAVLTANLVNLSRNNALALILIIFAVFSNISYTKPKNFTQREDTYYSTNESSTTVKEEYMPVWASEKINKRAINKIEIKGSAKIESETIKPTFYKVKVRSDSQSEMIVNSLYFPGWQVQIDGEKKDFEYKNRNGRINFLLPLGEHEVIIKYVRSTVHLLSEIVSLLSILTTLLLFLKWRKQTS